ncbi:hypothetical protein [Sphaerisporangium sp. NPDC051011]|uniref:hypothetical protein n=1 Tax=Sphaerisporangium sp. NPDC051011 TaxID=3155792 RepID=UPI0033DDF6F8
MGGMTGPDAHAPEPVQPARAAEEIKDDPYGFGPTARISVGGYFPPTTGRRTPDGLEAPATTGGAPRRDGRLYAVALVIGSMTEHAVRWSAAVPRAEATAACGIKVRVADISGSRVIWMPGVLMCQDCAAVVTGRAQREGTG